MSAEVDSSSVTHVKNSLEIQVMIVELRAEENNRAFSADTVKRFYIYISCESTPNHGTLKLGLSSLDLV